MASPMPADEGERAKNTTCTDRNQVEHLLFMPVTPRAREGFFLIIFFVCKRSQTVCRAAVWVSSWGCGHWQWIGRNPCRCSKIKGIFVPKIKSDVTIKKKKKARNGVHKVENDFDLKSRNKNKNLDLYADTWFCALLSTCQFLQALQVL